MMKVTLDTSPLASAHRYRGVGFYTKNLVDALKKLEGPEFQLKLAEKRPTAVLTDLVHYPYFDLFYHTLPVKKQTKIVVTIHDVTPLLFPDHYPPGIRGRFNLARQIFSLKSTTAVITDSEASKKDIVRFLGYPADRIHVVYLAPAPHFKRLQTSNIKLQTVKKKYQLPDKFVLYVGDVNYHKNVISLIRACRTIKAPLVLAGKAFVNNNFDKIHPENQPLVEIQREIAGNQDIHPLGFVTDEELVATYNLASVYCQPSFYEGFGLGVLEAMACGCPVVAAATGSLPEVCGRAAVLTAPQPRAFAHSLKMVLSNSDTRAKLVKAGRDRVKHFTWAKTAAKTLTVYEKAANR